MLDIINIYNFVLIRGVALSMNALVLLESSALIAVCNQKIILIPFSPNFPRRCSCTMVLRLSWHMMVIWLYFNHILNNFVVIHFVLLFFLLIHLRLSLYILWYQWKRMLYLRLIQLKRRMQGEPFQWCQPVHQVNNDIAGVFFLILLNQFNNI